MNINGVAYVKHLTRSYSPSISPSSSPILLSLSLLTNIHYSMQDEWQYRGNETITLVGS